RLPLVPALLVRHRDQPAARRRPQEQPENRHGDGQRGNHDDRFHDPKRVVEHPAAVRVQPRFRSCLGRSRWGATYTCCTRVTVYTDLFHYRELFGSLFRRDLRAKYKGSFLGLAWTLANLGTQLVAFVVMLGVVMVLALVFLPGSRGTVWLALPLGGLFVLLVSGVSLALASLNALYRDVEHLIAALLLPWFFLTPVLYGLDQLPRSEEHTSELQSLAY